MKMRRFYPTVYPYLFIGAGVALAIIAVLEPSSVLPWWGNFVPSLLCLLGALLFYGFYVTVDNETVTYVRWYLLRRQIRVEDISLIKYQLPPIGLMAGRRWFRDLYMKTKRAR